MIISDTGADIPVARILKNSNLYIGETLNKYYYTTIDGVITITPDRFTSAASQSLSWCRPLQRRRSRIDVAAELARALEPDWHPCLPSLVGRGAIAAAPLWSHHGATQPAPAHAVKHLCLRMNRGQ